MLSKNERYCFINYNTKATTQKAFIKTKIVIHSLRVKLVSTSATWSWCSWRPGPWRCGWTSRTWWSRRTRTRPRRPPTPWAASGGCCSGTDAVSRWAGCLAIWASPALSWECCCGISGGAVFASYWKRNERVVNFGDYCRIFVFSK